MRVEEEEDGKKKMDMAINYLIIDSDQSIQEITWLDQKAADTGIDQPVQGCIDQRFSLEYIHTGKNQPVYDCFRQNL